MPQSDDLQSMHGTANDALVRLLSERVRGLRSGISDLSTTAEKSAGNAPVPTNAPGQVNAPADSGCDQGPIA